MSGFAEYDQYDAVGLAKLVQTKAVNPEELLAAALDRAAAVDPSINAICLDLGDRARAAIKAGLPAGPLAGVPFLVKDLYAEIAGVGLTNGSALFKDYISDHNSTLVERYEKAGLAIFGRTASPEFGLCYTTEPRIYGPTRNPWNLDRVAGGSSGGAAAAVAAGIVPAAHASDGGGSIRVPASCCGLFGLKPTRARMPAGPDVGEGWAGLSTAHVITRSVRDSAAIMDATAGPDAGAPYWPPPPPGPFRFEVGGEDEPLRIGITTDNANDAPVHPECRAALDGAAGLCAELGHEIVEVTPAYDKAAMSDAIYGVVTVNSLATVEGWAARRGRPAAETELERATWAVVSDGRAVTGCQYVTALQTLHKVGRDIARLFADIDMLMTPTLAQPPLAIGALDMMTDDRDSYRAAMSNFAAFPALANVTGQPAMSVPLHWTHDDLPVGVQFIGRFGDEAGLFRLAGQLEAARPWANRRPPVTAALAPAETA